MSSVHPEVVFQSWLDRKNRERQEVKKAEEKKKQEILEMMEYRRAQGKMAYEKWLRARQLAEEEIHKEAIRRRQAQLLAAEKREKREKESAVAYSKWRRRKENEIKIMRQGEEAWLSPPTRAATPTMPGYCSVWSCDPHMTNVMTLRVKRPLTYSLTEPSIYDS